MSGSHSHAGTISSQHLWIATFLTLAFCFGEAAVGCFSNSLALMADAGHNFADALALALSAFAAWMATKPADSKRTFGYHRVGILAALANAGGLVVMAGVIFWEAFHRLFAPEAVQSMPMIWTALIAIILNSGIAWWLSKDAKEDLNIRSAFQHMVGDAAASFGVVIAGVIIFTGSNANRFEPGELAINGVTGVLDTHDLHVWTVSSGLIACCCHAAR